MWLSLSIYLYDYGMFGGILMDRNNKFFKMFIEVDSIAKKNKFRRFIFTTIKERGVIGLIKDIIHILKLVLGILK